MPPRSQRRTRYPAPGELGPPGRKGRFSRVRLRGCRRQYGLVTEALWHDTSRMAAADAEITRFHEARKKWGTRTLLLYRLVCEDSVPVMKLTLERVVKRSL